MQLQVPKGAAYAVLIFGGEQVAWCLSIEVVVRTITANRIAFRCEVVRVQGDVCVWPWKVKGGTA